MKPRKGQEPTQEPTETTLTCHCGWSRKAYPGEDAHEAARYHAIQVHNSIEATRKGKY